MRASLLIAVLAVVVDPALACQCGTVRTATEAREVSTWVFEGTAAQQSPTLLRFERILLPTQKVRFAVHRVWKGDVPREVTLLEGFSNCSWNFSAGERYLVFATPHGSEPGWLDAFKCTGPTGPVSWERSSVDALGQPLVTYQTAESLKRGSLSRIAQHATVYLLSGFAVFYAASKGDSELSVWVWLAPLATTFATGVAIGFIYHRLPRREGMLVSAAVCVLALLLAVLLTGAIFVHTSGWWFEHLLEQPVAGA